MWGQMTKAEKIEYRLLPGTLAGYYDKARDTIVIDPRLNPQARRSTIEHERVHRERGDGKCLNSWFDKKQELTVEREAARRLISIEAIIDGLLWSQDYNELAEHWDVDIHMATVRLTSLTPVERSHIESFLDLEEQFINP